ncbi:protein FAR-RED IMPAIRED RESPONSE 1-like [Helianthus annuus]|uniref:protein FAR-RED IMPAIRED RESPONSE 1-like n=1 Tax=Helianthus annuus TaxID=4232 RepID=UPI0016531FFE|nr:protein FAR-RED IMPAIRED RESPONSE 1-like [Helianthus annuus]
MVINRMTDKKKYLADYSFEYSVDDDKRLTSLFWADGLCKLNYMEFGDVISFDATFKINRYKMVFVPFTGIDNRCRNPNVVVTDQDPAMKQAIEEVGHELCNNDEFKRRMCDIVWTDSIKPEEFERQWKLVMIEFGLTENKWIDDMFGMRSMWIPAFYRHEPMSGLMRTTSRSESENRFFCQVANSQLTLVEFMNYFDGAMDVQRFNHRKNDHISRYTEPADWSQTTLEKDAAKIYTRSIIFDQQLEIHGTISECLPMNTKVEGLRIRILLKDFKAHGDGLLEMFGVKEIPNKYVTKRWTKDVVPNELNVKYNLNIGGKDVQHKAKRIALTNAPPTVRVPAGIRNKGRGSHRRIKSKKEQMINRKGKRSRTCSVCNEKGHDIRTCGELKAKQQGKQGKKKMKGVQIEDGLRDQDNKGEDDEEEDDFEDYSSDDGYEEEDQWEEVSRDEDDEDE